MAEFETYLHGLLIFVLFVISLVLALPSEEGPYTTRVIPPPGFRRRSNRGKRQIEEILPGRIPQEWRIVEE